ncbi:unnamed protein product [Nezara viridula]|uniref:Uncharacterized protein n=1 Tax=Nezara viridula TaxID=85310 RepID=A0A9P0EBH2_NEZVI|nr:unnamed protein product [Nezara viridula]
MLRHRIPPCVVLATSLQLPISLKEKVVPTSKAQEEREMQKDARSFGSWLSSTFGQLQRAEEAACDFTSPHLGITQSREKLGRRVMAAWSY